jgi:hypothetical protein
MAIIMKCGKVGLILLVSLGLLFIDQAFSSELDDYPVIQCPGGLISVGDSRFSVLEKCGKPTYEEDFGNVWIYDYGPKEFLRYITFEEDKVDRLQMGGYGEEH